MPTPFIFLQRSLRSVRVRLMLWYLAVMTLLLLAFCGILYLVVARVALNNLDENLRTAAHQLSATYKQFHQLKPADMATDPLSKKEVVLLFNDHGEIIQTQGPVSSGMIRQIQQALPVPDEITDRWLVTSPATEPLEYRLFALPLPDQYQQQALLVVGTLRTDQFAIHYLLIGIGLAGPTILLVTAGCGYWLASRAMRPVRVMTQTAREIEETDLSRRLNIHSQDELGELALTFDHMLSRLETAFKRQSQFTTDASHELRTPLSIITLAVNRGLSHCHTQEDYRSVLQTIQAENEHMSRLVNDLLLLARADGEQARLKKERVDLSDVTLDMIARLLPLAERCNIDLIPGDFPVLWVMGDEAALASMLTNLIENALKYTSGVGGRVLVEGGSENNKQGRWAWIRIADNGPGIAAEHLPHLFDRFYRGDAARSASQSTTRGAGGTSAGSGLGLSIVQWVAHAHGGEVRVQSELGRGSTFEVCLPLLDDQGADF
jgi:signal transduction histidine kinase